MKAIIIDTFNNYEIRSAYVYSHLKNLGYDVTIIASDFSHTLKKKLKQTRQDTIFIDTKPYKKNISIGRLSSHLDFSNKVYKKIKEMAPDLIYCIIPLNSLVAKIDKYSKKRDVKIYFDVFDLWPESMPTGQFFKKMLFAWKNLRNKHIKCARKVFVECSYYQCFLPSDTDMTTAYLCKPKREIDFVYDDQTLRFVYLGSINNIIDIDGIVNLLKGVKEKRKVSLSIIGAGEAKENFKQSLQDADIPFDDYGVVYDDAEKDKILSKCHFGINMYKARLCIGLTMKSLEYFSRGLPLINANIYDTAKIVEEMECGFDITDGDERVKEQLWTLNKEKWMELRRNCKETYNRYFSDEIFYRLMEEHIV